METKTEKTTVTPSFETVWAILQEVGKKHEEHMEEMKALRESQKETDRMIKETGRKISKLGGRFGEMTEYMVIPNLLDKFSKLGFEFSKAYLHASLKDENRNFITEIDITLEDGDKVMLVEVKTKPDIEDIKEHVERMEKVRAYADKRKDKRKYLGAIAGMVINENVKTFAFKNGFYVIQPSGDTFNISAPEGYYTAREW